VERGKPVVVEHRSLDAMWKRRTPIIAESSGFDPNRDAGDLPAESAVKTGVTPWAFLAGPVLVEYDSSESKSRVAPELARCIEKRADITIVRSVTGQIELNTADGYCTVNAPRCQGVAAHFAKRGEFKLADVTIRSQNDFGAVMVVSLDGQPLSTSKQVLVQVGTQCRPTGWKTEPVKTTPRGGTEIDARRVTDYGHAPWAVECPEVEVAIRNGGLSQAVVLDMNGNPRGTIDLAGTAVRSFAFPRDAIYVVIK
jgi:hypothetical protein